jgi:hypothetical protein
MEDAGGTSPSLGSEGKSPEKNYWKYLHFTVSSCENYCNLLDQMTGSVGDGQLTIIDSGSFTQDHWPLTTDGQWLETGHENDASGCTKIAGAH